MKKVFVIGLEPFNLEMLDALVGDEDIEFHEALSADEAVNVDGPFKLHDLIQLAEQRMDEYGPADGILNYWDFPGACLGPMLAKRNGLPGPSLESVATLEHKYWARREMEKVIPEASTRYCAVDPFADDPRSQVDLKYPYWIKPFVSHSSYLGFKISGEEDFNTAIQAIREGIGLFGDPFNEFLDKVDMPEDLKNIGGRHCIAEESIAADAQVTLEGYAFDGDVVVYGAVDSVREGGAGSSFSRYEYPSALPSELIERMSETTKRYLRHVGLDNSAFNVEFFWDRESDRISLLEVNTRLSKSHAPLFRDVDGRSHQKIGLDLALGRRPQFQKGAGDWPYAAKFMVRLFQDGKIKRVPSATEIHHMQTRYPEAMVQVLVEEGQRLSHLAFQDSYSFEVADIFIGGRSNEELVDKYTDMMDCLPFEVDLTAPAPQ
ncbi:ATP-grasp domain-containing protein [Stakelama saccharophila]|uniref:ATP-grasp domain-containing protein n=1 Tax=Stakelama saccharophila TaxID=3075605 RepID=A0ABZ0B685_9SPHN|nr:hypothetical protein [Stakelama sp. W311]WNO52910.1 hypothetical protein RPR59_10630 [Stakelama sp. W311]